MVAKPAVRPFGPRPEALPETARFVEKACSGCNHPPTACPFPECLRAANPTGRYNRKATLQRMLIQELLREGWDVQRIADFLQIQPRTVYRLQVRTESDT